MPFLIRVCGLFFFLVFAHPLPLLGSRIFVVVVFRLLCLVFVYNLPGLTTENKAVAHQHIESFEFF